MSERPISDLTLREMFTNAETLIRDLQDHLKNSFHPKSRSVEDLVQTHHIPAERDAVPDSTVRQQMKELLSSDDYSETLLKKLDQYLTAIEERSREAIANK
ncbi:MAG: hypothetical protein JSS02_21540 [Planctomycetes bacterium]|nr:hypothetical protein [Planctomycetota bacterium]